VATPLAMSELVTHCTGTADGRLAEPLADIEHDSAPALPVAFFIA
jgi:hypothetical protein